ncbi:ABC transporter ATP-binding protein [Nordella sp. HKS 07]|uniref:ABC transporter ATP-binding protein n=1 Tax=Nordella sp. HKS 07 TaxID=2712222 RepID=UPI001FF025D7|nr:ABC transporter ATP-binding protein [Nordella sp. HKS 07]
MRNIDVFYDDLHILHGASLDVGAGELVGVVGANGHGKSTLLKAVCGLVPVAGGDIVYAGESIRSNSVSALVARGLVYVAEDRRLFPDMTVRENLLLGAFLERGRSHEQASLDRVFDLYPRLAERQEQLARTLSGGEAQMLALGRGLMSAPALLAIDEPSLGLAPKLVDSMLETIAELKRGGMTILLVEQSLGLIDSIVDRVYRLEEGVVSGGEARTVFQTASFQQSASGSGQSRLAPPDI